MPKKFQMNLSDLRKKVEDVQKKKTDFNKESKPALPLYKIDWKDKKEYKAIIRFLPSPDTDIPWVKQAKHYYQDPKTGMWVIVECPTTIGEKCPICEANYKAWNDGEQDLYRLRKKKQSYYANILVIKDPANPENEGQVFIYKFPETILTKINDMLFPVEDEIEGKRDPVNVFDYYEGCNFKLKLKMKEERGKKAGYPDYADCEFSPSTSLEDDYNLEDVHSKLHSLFQFIDPKKFPSYEEIEKRFLRASGKSDKTSLNIDEDVKAVSSDVETGDDLPFEISEDNDTTDDFFSKLKED